MKTWNKIHVDPTKRGNPNGGESEDTRLNHRKCRKVRNPWNSRTRHKIIIYKYMERESEEERERVRERKREKPRERKGHRETRVMRARRGGRRRGSRVAGIADAVITDAGVASRRSHKRGVRDPRSSQGTRRTQTRVLSPRRVDTRGTQTRAWTSRCVDTITRRPR